MEDRRKCFETESYQFAVRQLVSRAVREEKLRIARNLFEKTDLTLKQIAEIVDIKVEDLERVFSYVKRDKSKVKYNLQVAVTKEEQLLAELSRNLAIMEGKNHSINNGDRNRN